MIKISTEDKNLRIETMKAYTLPDVTIILLNALLYMMNKALEQAPVKDRDDLKANIYDMVNMRCSALLETFAPEFELHPGLTEQAILKAENEILEDEMSKVS